MKHITALIFLAALCALPVSGVRTYPRPKTIVQPDGTSLTIVGHGDEFRHYVTTTDGYTLVKGYDGVYRYAVMSDGRLKASQVKASDVNDRAVTEKNFLLSVERNLKPEVTATGRQLMKLAGRTDSPLHKLQKRSGVRNGDIAPDQYRGLVIMVNFTDRQFSRGEQAHGMVDQMMNGVDYNFYIDPVLSARVECTGSVRDYFYDNSKGTFVPEFDVVGPVDVDVNQYYINGTNRSYELCRKVLEAADSEIDYTRYDSDGDGEVDMLYILYAGYSSNYQGNDERLVWPHAGHFADSHIDLQLDGVRFGRFACSAEIYGWHADGDLYLDGIGVIVHEFSHVLGFKDHYDVSGYYNEEPNTWDVMASGNYNGVFNDTPCGYNSYEKYAAGFITPRTLTRENDQETVSLRALSDYDDAIRIVSTQDSTVFMLENRQLKKWDKELPGHGMLIWRVDSCDREYWEHNALNVNGRLHLKLVRALGATRDLFQEIEDTDYDPFPGTRHVDAITNYSIESNLLTDHNYPSPLMLRNIQEDNEIISFTVVEDPVATNRPYTFRLYENYVATGTDDSGKDCAWNVHTATIQNGYQERLMIYNLAPDTRNIAATSPVYADGLGAAYALNADKTQVIIEPYRVALTEDNGVWLVDFNNLDNGGSGAILLNMNPYGDITLANPDAVLGYCTMPKNKVIVTPENIIERFSLVKNVQFNAGSGSGVSVIPDETTYRDNTIYNLQGIRVTNPRKGDIYIIGGKKVKY